MNDREKALEELKRHIKEQKARIDPAVLEQARQAAEARQLRQPYGDTSVPFDRKSAAKAVELFLKSHPDPKDLERLIAEIVAKTRH